MVTKKPGYFLRQAKIEMDILPVLSCLTKWENLLIYLKQGWEELLPYCLPLTMLLVIKKGHQMHSLLVKCPKVQARHGDKLFGCTKALHPICHLKIFIGLRTTYNARLV